MCNFSSNPVFLTVQISERHAPSRPTEVTFKRIFRSLSMLYKSMYDSGINLLVPLSARKKKLDVCRRTGYHFPRWRLIQSCESCSLDAHVEKAFEGFLTLPCFWAHRACTLESFSCWLRGCKFETSTGRGRLTSCWLPSHEWDKII